MRPDIQLAIGIMAAAALAVAVFGTWLYKTRRRR